MGDISIRRQKLGRTSSLGYSGKVVQLMEAYGQFSAEPDKWKEGIDLLIVDR